MQCSFWLIEDTRVDDGIDRPSAKLDKVASANLVPWAVPARVVRWLNRPKQRRAVVSASRSVCVANGKTSLESYLGMAVGWMRKQHHGEWAAKCAALLDYLDAWRSTSAALQKLSCLKHQNSKSHKAVRPQPSFV